MLTGNEVVVLDIIEHNPGISVPQAAKLIGCSVNNAQSYMSELAEHGMLSRRKEKIGREKRSFRYYISERGLIELSKLNAKEPVIGHGEAISLDSEVPDEREIEEIIDQFAEDLAEAISSTVILRIIDKLIDKYNR